VSVTQQATSLADVEIEVARLERARTDALTEHAQALRCADAEAMVAARHLVERLTSQRAALLAPRIHARLAAAERDRDARAAELAAVQQTAQAAQQDVLDQRSRLAGLNSLDSSGRRDAVQRLAGYEATAAAAEEEVVGARRGYAAGHAWAADLAREARRLDAATESIMTGAAIAARAAVVERDERRAAIALSGATVLVRSAAAHQDACLEGLRLAERETAATRDALAALRLLIASGNILDPLRHRREAEVPALERAIQEAEDGEGVAQRRYAAASRQLTDATAEQRALVQRHAERLSVFVRTLDELLDAGMGVERALSVADETVR